jgi:hypothetical protein
MGPYLNFKYVDEHAAPIFVHIREVYFYARQNAIGGEQI